MCGISAIVGPGATGDPDAIGRMVDAIVHRGPDEHASKTLAGCSLGHARLSIIDLSSGAQPMTDVSQRWWIAFNGEIYNYPALREELVRAGCKFQTSSDTEVLLAGYERWGSGLLDRLRGMFAFAIWDTREQTLFAARDLFGEKPLFYASGDDGTLILASEIKAIIASKRVATTVDPQSLDAFLALGYMPPDRTIYREVHTLPPAHFLTARGRDIRVSRYWEPRLEPQQMSLDDAAERLRGLVKQAVKRQMTADVPVGAFLSGGLDSSTIVALMSAETPHPVKTFSVGFGSYINELPYARAVATQYGTEHHEIDLGEPDVPALLETMTRVYDEPFADSSHIPTYLISEYARQSVKVVLSGDGGDELFGGYYWYLPLAQSDDIAMPFAQWLVLRTASKLIGHRNENLAHRSHAAGLAARWDDLFTRNVMSQTIFPSAMRKSLSPSGGSYSVSDYYRPGANVTGLNRAFYLDLLSYLPGDILVKVDRAAMAHGLETRAPFLDRDVVDFALTIPPSLKVSGGRTKIVMNEAFQRDWPRELWGRKKQGFGAPTTKWLRLPAMQPLLDRVFASGSPLRRLLPGVPARARNGLDYRTWVLLTLGLWLERHPQ